MKIKYALLDKLYTLTNKEIDLVLYVARYQNDHGCSYGIYYRAACENTGMCKQSFYSTLRSLQRKGIITYEHADRDYDITILGNDFSYPESYHEGYVNVARKVFRTKKFRALKAKEKVLLLHFMKITHSADGSYQIGTAKFYGKYMQLLGVTKRVLRGYLHSLKSFFAIGVKDGKYFISYLASVFRERVEESESDQYMGHLVDTSCRRARIKEIPPEDVQETVKVMKQYRKVAETDDRNIFEVVDRCIRDSVKGAKDRVLKSKYVHKLVRSTLGLPAWGM